MRIRRNGYKIRLPGRIAVQGAPPLDIFHPTRQKRALGTPDRAEPLGWLDQHLLARFARLARYAVAQRVQNSRFGPHNGLKMRPTYKQKLRPPSKSCGLRQLSDIASVASRGVTVHVLSSQSS